MALNREGPELAVQFYEESVALSRRRRDAWGLARTLSGLVTAYYYRGDLSRATGLFEESMSLYRECGDKRGLGPCLNNLGMLVYS